MHFLHNTYIFIDAVEEVVSPGGIARYHNRKKEMTFDQKVYMYQVTWPYAILVFIVYYSESLKISFHLDETNINVSVFVRNITTSYWL